MFCDSVPSEFFNYTFKFCSSVNYSQWVSQSFLTKWPGALLKGVCSVFFSHFPNQCLYENSNHFHSPLQPLYGPVSTPLSSLVSDLYYPESREWIGVLCGLLAGHSIVLKDVLIICECEPQSVGLTWSIFQIICSHLTLPDPPFKLHWRLSVITNFIVANHFCVYSFHTACAYVYKK